MYSPSDQHEPSDARPSRALLNALDALLYRPQFVAIGTDNDGWPVEDLAAARAAVAAGEASSAGGRLAPGVLGADIDTDDPVLGDAVAEELLRFLAVHELAYVLRESGRRGGRHVLGALASPAVRREWKALCSRISRQLGVVVDDRTGRVLRLLTAPHRAGLASPVLSCTITPEILPAARTPPPRRRGKRSPRATGTCGGSRSETEFGAAAALARSGTDTVAAWSTLSTPGSKAAARGRRWWQRYVWLPAVTTAAAEDGTPAEDAWQRARTACSWIDRTWWLGLWERSLAEAATERPRRRRVGSRPALAAGDLGARIAVLQAGLQAAVDAELAGVDVRRQRSVAAVMSALAPALEGRNGSMSLRDLSVRSRLSLGAVRAALATAIEHGLLVRTHIYAGGSRDCHAYGIGAAAQQHVSAAGASSRHTSCSTPRPTGSCSPTRLRAAYARDRARWRLRCDVIESLAPGERLADSRHPAAKILRSLHYQRTWWTSLTPAEQDQRRTDRRTVLAQLHRSQRSAWLSWLDTRADLTAAADRVLTHRATTADTAQLLAAPKLVHRGLRDPQWRLGTMAAPSAILGHGVLCPV